MRRLLTLCAMLLALVIAVPAFAYEPGERIPIDEVPYFDWATSGRSEFNEVVTGAFQMRSVGHRVVEAQGRSYAVIQTLWGDGTPFETSEIVFYGSRFYYRYNEDPQWYYVDLDSFATAQEEENFVTYMGKVNVAGNATDQYQAWYSFEDGDYGKYDIFVGADSLIHQEVLTIGIINEELGNITSTYTERYYDLNAPVKVYEPQNAIPDPDFLTSLRNPSTPRGVVLRGMIYKQLITR